MQFLTLKKVYHLEEDSLRTGVCGVILNVLRPCERALLACPSGRHVPRPWLRHGPSRTLSFCGTWALNWEGGPPRFTHHTPPPQPFVFQSLLITRKLYTQQNSSRSGASRRLVLESMCSSLEISYGAGMTFIPSFIHPVVPYWALLGARCCVRCQALC